LSAMLNFYCNISFGKDDYLNLKHCTF